MERNDPAIQSTGRKLSSMDAQRIEKDLFFIWDESAWHFQNGTGSRNWQQYAEHIQGHGNLGGRYPKYKYGVEGDTPSFLYIWPNGLIIRSTRIMAAGADILYWPMQR